MWFCIQVAVSIANHVQDLPEYAHSVRVATLSNPTRENLTAAWKQWVESAGTQSISKHVTLHTCACITCSSTMYLVLSFTNDVVVLQGLSVVS